MKLLTFNILHGGGKRVPDICRVIEQHNADVIVLTEFRDNTGGAEIRSRLRACGWANQASSHPPARANGVLVLSKIPFTQTPVLDDVPGGSCRWIECDFQSFILVGTYFPLEELKIPHWKWFMHQASTRSSRPCILMGDFNTGKHFIDETGATFIGPEYLGQLEQLGFIDAWRHFHPEQREYTWYSQANNGFRLDYAFASKALAPRLIQAFHSHAERELKVSDHSALLVELDTLDRD